MPSTTVQPAGIRSAGTGSTGPVIGRAGPRAHDGPGPAVRLLDRPLASYHLLLGAGLSLTVLGLVMVLSASSVESFQASGSVFSVAQKQALWVAVGLPLMWVTSRVPPRAFRAFPGLLLVASTIGLVLVLIPGIGREAGGNRNWIDLGGTISVQPSEAAKLALALWGANLLARKHRLLGRWRHLLVPLLPVAGVVLALVLLGGDLGTAAVLLAIVLALLFFAGAPARLFGGLVAIMASAGALLVAAEPYRMARLTSFLDPFDTYYGSGWQGAQSIFALASGGVSGVGLGASREKWGYLPEAHTDFIFAIIGEELGLLGTLTVLALFAAIGCAGFRIAFRSRDRFVTLAAAALTCWIVVQAVVNVGTVLGVLPITGIPLPLVSYGGSALLPVLVALGMLQSFARREPAARAALAARARRRSHRGRAGRGSARPRPPGRRPAAG